MTETKPTAKARRGRIFPEIQWSEEKKQARKTEREAFRQRCEVIFKRVQPELIETHYNWYISVEPDSGDYFIDKDEEVATQKAQEKHRNAKLYLFRINETGVSGTI
ncbi:hypothetical protein [Coleofasciculus sp. H7-2]|uniref:hypothetical protein n=1 Tax=Coleofasciculus sp. H7-2 TaxID=3351545 RepID=UPI00366AEB03